MGEGRSDRNLYAHVGAARRRNQGGDRGSAPTLGSKCRDPPGRPGEARAVGGRGGGAGPEGVNDGPEGEGAGPEGVNDGPEGDFKSGVHLISDGVDCMNPPRLGIEPSSPA